MGSLALGGVQAEEPQETSQEQAQGEPSTRKIRCSSHFFMIFGENLSIHTTASGSEGVSRVTLAESCSAISDPPFGSTLPVLLKRSAVRVLYGKKCVKLGSKASLEHTQFGCLSLLIIVTVAQIVI